MLDKSLWQPKFAGFAISILCYICCAAETPSVVAQPDLGEISKRRASAERAASIALAEQDRSASDTRDYWHRRQPRRIPLSAEDRSVVHAALETTLNAPELNLEYVEHCLAICQHDTPSPKLERLLFQLIEKLPRFSLSEPGARSRFSSLIWNVCQQESASAQALIVELIAPDPRFDFKTVAKHLFEVTNANEHVRLSNLAAATLTDSASLDFVQETLQKASARLDEDSPFKPALTRSAEIVEQKLEGRIYLGDSVP